MSNEILDKAFIEWDDKDLDGKKPKFVIGVDTYDKKRLAYCIVRKFGSETVVMHQKTMKDEDEFREEVRNLAKYFNADTLGE